MYNRDHISKSQIKFKISQHFCNDESVDDI